MASLDNTLDRETIAKIRAELLQETPQNGDATVNSTTSSPEYVQRKPRDIYSRSKNNVRRVKGNSQLSPPLATRSSPTLPTTTNDDTSPQDMMAYSMGLIPEAFGDTQPIDSQIYKDYTTSMLNGDESTVSKTLQDGDTGHVNFVNTWEEEVRRERESSFLDDGEFNDKSPETQFRVPPSPDRVSLPPETPALAGQKRNYRGEILSSVAKTPGSAVADMFGFAAKPAVSLTQAFNATQAPSSPLPGAPQSDPIFERPSPNFQAWRPSSARADISSPIKNVQSDPVTRSMEPRTTYRSMKESQELREQRRREQEEIEKLEAQIEDDDFESELIAEERRAELKRRQVRLGSLNTKLQYSDALFTTPATARGKKGPDVMEISDDIPEEEEDAEGDEFVPPTVVRNSTLDDIIELGGVQVPMTSSRPGIDGNGPGGSQRSQGGKDVSNFQYKPVAVSAPIAASQRVAALRNSIQEHATQTVAVADSQPENLAATDDLPVAPKLIEPSSDDIVPPTRLRLTNSVYARLDTQTRQVLDSSDVPMPPPVEVSSDPPEETDTRMPSSPPVMPHTVSVDQDEMGEDNADEDEMEMDLVATGEPGSDGAPEEADAATVIGVPEQQQERNEAQQEALTNDEPPATAQSTIQKTVEVAKPTVDSASNPATHLSALRSGSGLPQTLSLPQTGSHSNSTFTTAHSHLPMSPQKHQVVSHASAITNPSPSKVTRTTRKLTEIAAQSSNEEPSVDIDFDILTKDDEEFSALMSGSSPVAPSRKRRKVYGGKAVRLPIAEAPNTSSPAASTPIASDTAEKKAGREPAPPVQEDTPSVYTMPAVPRIGALKRPAQPARAIDKTPLKKVDTPMAPKTGPLTKRTMEIAETPQIKSHEPSSEVNISPAEQPKPKAQAKPKEQPRPKAQSKSKVKASRISQPTAPAIPMISTPVQNNPLLLQTDFGTIVAPNRVLALFKGGKMQYYPATCLGYGQVDGSSVRIRFDDGTIDNNLELGCIRTLSLRPGDLVKVDLPGMRAKSYVVCGFKDKREPTSDELPADDTFPPTDVYGFQTVVLAVKPRDSISTPTASSSTDTVDVPIWNIYITQTLWSRYNDRLYTPNTLSPATSMAVQTPSVQTGIPGTPKSRRLLASTTSRFRESSVASSGILSDLFSGMAFAISFANDKERDKTSKLLTEHGAQLLANGFDNLFSLPSSSGPPSPSKSPRKADGITPNGKAAGSNSMSLTPSASSLGFVALITDTHSRRAKYMQALALGLPCLHQRWLSDCVAKQVIVPFAPYLLPAGESAFLGGAVRSRLLTPYDPTDARLSETISGRSKLLEGMNVLLITGKGKIEERRKAYLFLTHALGAAKVVKMQNLEAAKARLAQGGKWDWVYVDGKVDEAERVLFGSGEGKIKAGKKRKRESGSTDPFEAKKERTAKVVTDEFVIQSLILGSLME